MTRVNDGELTESLQIIREVIEGNEFDSVLFLGDINCDFTRNTRFVQNIQSFLSELDLIKAWDKFEVDFTHFQETNGITHVSLIDHFFWNDTIDGNILEAGVIHHCDNMSDHSPIYCLVDVDSIPVEASAKKSSQANIKPSWKRASDEEKKNFPIILNKKLSNISVPDEVKNCRNVK